LGPLGGCPRVVEMLFAHLRMDLSIKPQLRELLYAEFQFNGGDD
jgi:hypothetical protein